MTHHVAHSLLGTNARAHKALWENASSCDMRHGLRRDLDLRKPRGPSLGYPSRRETRDGTGSLVPTFQNHLRFTLR